MDQFQKNRNLITKQHLMPFSGWMLDADVKGAIWTTPGAGGKLRDPSAFCTSPYLKYAYNLKQILQHTALFCV